MSSKEISGGDSERVSTASYETENIRPLFENEMFLERQRYPESPEDSYAFIQEVERLAQAGKHIALVDGSFDVPQPNHQWYLHHCRLIAAKDHHKNIGQGLGDVQALAASNDVVLIVSVDTDERVAGLKGNRAEKGGIPKPVYPWQLRAQYISNFMTPTSDGLYRPIVDIVTIDGYEKEFGTPHESHLALGAALLEKGALHTWLFYGEHDSKKNQAEKLISLSGQNTRAVGIVEHINYSLDADGKPWKSSSIIKKIRSS